MSGKITPTPEDVATAARTVEDAFDPETGTHPIELFHAISRTTVRPTVELAIFDVTKQKVLLTRRERSDPHFSNMWHLPGVMKVTADIQGSYPDANDNAALRAMKELQGTRITSLLRLSPRWVTQGARMGPRGGEDPIVYGALLVDEVPSVGDMFPVDDLPEPIYEHHPPIIAEAQVGMTLAPALELRII